MSSISFNRFTVITASIAWFFIVEPGTSPDAAKTPSPLKNIIFILILILEIGENLSASGNIMSMERDWVVVASSPDGREYNLTHLNSVMRRIDLICKLVAPILVSIIISATNNKIGVIVVGGMSATSWGVEMLSARNVWNGNRALQAPKIRSRRARSASQASSIPPNGLFDAVCQALRRYIQDFRNYFSSSVWVPSLSLSLLHFSALSYGATFITFLLSAGFSLDLITIARAVGSLVEISSTVVTPVGVQVLGRAKNHGRLGALVQAHEEASTSLLERPREEEGRTITGLERLGLWGLTWQLLNLVSLEVRIVCVGL
jgi:iron-regulated transporter 1